MNTSKFPEVSLATGRIIAPDTLFSHVTSRCLVSSPPKTLFDSSLYRRWVIRASGSVPDCPHVVDKTARVMRILTHTCLSTKPAYASFLVIFSYRLLHHGGLPVMSLPRLGSHRFVCSSVTMYPEPLLCQPFLRARLKRSLRPLIQPIELFAT